MYGEHTLSRSERHRLQAGEDEERRKANSAEQERQQDHATLVARMTEWTTWVREQIEAVRSKQVKLTAEMNEILRKITEDFDGVDREADKRDVAIRALQGEVADLRARAAAASVEQLNTLHATLTRSAELSMKAFEQAAARADLSTVDFEKVTEVAQKANELSAELRRLREAQHNFKFAREGDDDPGVTDLPADYLPRSRRH
jgi:hypothetical protein